MFVCAVAAASLAVCGSLTSVASARAATTASFTWSPSAPVSGQAVTFTSTSTADSGHAIRFYAWDVENDGKFDDSTTATATRTFGAPGTYTVRLVVVDDHGSWSLATRTVTVANAPPVAAFNLSPAAPLSGVPVTFSSVSSDVDGHIVNQAWDLDGDGRFGDASGSVAVTTFSSPGAHFVALRVTDDNGLSAVLQRSVTVAPAPAGPVGEPGSDSEQGHSGAVGFDTGAATPPVATAPGLSRLVPFPVVRIRGSATRSSTRVTLFTVSAPAGARVEISCRGSSCRRHSLAKVVHGAGNPPIVHIGAFERALRPGTRIEVRVTAPGLVGKYTRLVIRRLAAPRRLDSCLMPGSTRPSACPAQP